MKKVYKYQNGIIHVTLSKSNDQEKLKKATEEFLKKVTREVIKNGNTNTSGNFTEKQVLH